MSKVYEVTFHLDQHWLEQFEVWLEFAEVEPDEVFIVKSIREISNV